MSIDRRALDVLLAVVQIEQRELAEWMGYDAAYTANVLNGFTQLSRPFRRAFGEAVGDLILGDELGADVYPAGPLLELIERRAAEASNRNDFFSDLGLNKQGLRNRRSFSGADVDRICCELGVHPSDLYPGLYSLGEAS